MLRFPKLGGAATVKALRWQSSKAGASSPKSAQTQEWSKLRGSFAVNYMQAQENVTIAPSFQPRFAPYQTTYEAGDFSLQKKKFDATMREIAQLEGKTKFDRFDVFGVNPLDLWKSPTVLSQFVTTNGKIMPGWVLGHKGKSQKKLAKAIRRCRAAGLLSTVHRSVFDS